MSFKLRLAAIGTAALALTACSAVDHSLGEAVRYNTAIQTVNPDPVYDEADEQPGYHGEKGQKAVQRYRTGAVKEVVRETTTSGPQ